MELLEIVYYPEECLRNVSSPVEKFDEKLRSFSTSLLKTMFYNNGLGLAAPQVGVNMRIFVMNIAEDKNTQDDFVIINPVIENTQGEISYEEGCLSIPQVKGNVKRFQSLILHYQDMEGKTHSLEATDLMAVCVQHEVDHLDGKLFFDRLPYLQRKFLIKKYFKIKEKL